MSHTRRAFLSAAALAALAPTVPATARAAPRVRKNVKKLDQNSDDIVALQKAIATMRRIEKNGPGANERACHAWRAWAEIHGVLDGTKTNQCRHFSWLFFPWHRAYLDALERLVRKLSGFDGFAMPFWPWEEDTPTAAAMPALFAPGTGGVAEFNNPKRTAATSGRAPKNDKFTQDQIDGEIGKAYVDGLLASNFGVFAGTATDQGAFEDGPHQFVHKWVRGDMLTAGAAYDPVFWLHHCNIDRWWDKWAAKHPRGTPKDENWLPEKLGPFCDGDGKEYTLTVAGVLGDKLGYKYDGTEAAAKMEPVAAGLIAVSDGLAALNLKEWAPAPGNSAIGSTKLTEAMTKELGGVLKANLGDIGLRIRLRGFNERLDPDVSLRVFLVRGEKATEPSPKNPGYVGTAPVARGWHHPKEHKEHKGAGAVLDGTRAFRRLFAGKGAFPPKGNAFGLQFVPVHSDGTAIKGKVEDYYPQETIIDVLSQEA